MKVPLLSGRQVAAAGRQVVAALERLGFAEIHRKGSHVKMEHPDGRRIVFPFHPEIDRYTLKAPCATPTLILHNSSSRSSKPS